MWNMREGEGVGGQHFIHNFYLCNAWFSSLIDFFNIEIDFENGFETDSYYSVSVPNQATSFNYLFSLLFSIEKGFF